MSTTTFLVVAGSLAAGLLIVFFVKRYQNSLPPITATPPDYASTLKTAIDDAAQVLAYASRSGTTLNSSDVEAILQAHTAGSSITIQQEAAFWAASSSIAKTISPVTLETIKSTASIDGKSVAARAAGNYRVRTMLTLVALLLFQIYWLVGATVTSDLKEIRGRLEKLAEQAQKEKGAFQALSDKDPDYATKKIAADLTYERWDTLVWQEKISAWADFEVLRNWNVLKRALVSKTHNEPIPPSSSVTTTRESEQRTHEIKETDYFLWVFTPGNAEEIQTSQIVLTALLKYVLPILYGALGASAYIVRVLADEIRSYTFSSGSVVRYELRYYLGAVAGFSIAWFTSDSKSTESAGILQSLSPLALAFLAGYSVDLLFSFLDRLASVFSSTSSKQPT